MVVEIMGVSYPMEYTVEVQKKFFDKFGGTGKAQIEAMTDTTDPEKFAENTAFAASAMMEGAVNRVKVRCRMLGDEYRGGDIPKNEDLEALFKTMRPGEVFQVMNLVMKTMSEGNKVEVETKEEKGKKRNAALSK